MEAELTALVAAARDAVDRFEHLERYKPSEVIKDDFAYDRVLEAVHEAAKKGADDLREALKTEKSA